MLYVKFTINDVIIDNSKLLESIKFSTTTTNTYSVGTFYYTITTIKLDNSVDIKTGDVVKFYLSEDNTTWIDYGIYEPYSIKKQTLYREVTLYSMPSLKLLEKYVPNQTDYTTRTLLTEMQLNLNIVIEDFDSILAIDMQGVKSDAGMTILSQVAMLLGCNVLITRNGTIRFVDANYNNNTEHTVTTSNITEMVKYDSYPYQITRVLGKLSSDVENPIIVGTQANEWNDLTIENPYLTVGICDSILGTLSPCVFNGYKLKVFNVPISMNVLDTISFVTDGETVKMPITNLEIVYSVGGLVANIDVPLSNSANNTSAFKGSISTRLDVIKNIQSELNTKVEIVDGNVSSLISRTDVIEGDITTINEQYSQINQTIGEIDLRVGEVQTELDDKVSTDEIISSINLSTEGIKIQGDKLELTGDTIIISDGNNMTLEEYLNQEELTSNLLTQPTFNDGIGTWEISVSVYIKKDTTHVREVDGVTSEGVKFNYTGTSNALALWTNDWTVNKLTANTKYTAKAYVYFEDTSTLTGNMTLAVYGNVGETLTLISEKAFTSSDFVANEWNEISMEFTTTQDYDNPRYQIRCSKGCVAWITDCAVHGVKSLTQEELVEILNGSGDGFYLIDNKLYINADYIQTGTLRADLIKVNVDGATKNLLPFNYVTMDSAINTKFYINEDDNGYPFADCELPIYGGGGSSDFMCVPFGYSNVTIESGKHYWFTCEYYAVWNNDTKPNDGVGTSTIGNGKYGTKTGNNLDIFLYDGDDISKLNTGRNLLDGTAGNKPPRMFSADTYAQSGFALSVSTSDGGTTMRCASTTEENYLRFMPPVANEMYGLEASCTYTLSGYTWGTMSEIHIRHQYHVNGGSWTGTDTYPVLVYGDGVTEKYFEYTFTIPSDAVGFYLSFQDYALVLGKWVCISKLKLEKSSKATSWCLSPADKGEEIPTYVEESTPLFTLASVLDFNDSINIVTDSTYGNLERGWTRLIGRIDAEESYTGKLWLGIDCSGFNSGDYGWFYLSTLQLTDAEENDENIELDYIQQIREKHIELTDGSYYTGIYSVDGIDLTEGTIHGESETSLREFEIDYDGYNFRSITGSEDCFLGLGKSNYSYDAGSSGTIHGYDELYGVGCRYLIENTGDYEGIFCGVHKGFQIPNSTTYGRADIYVRNRYSDRLDFTYWTDWSLLGEKVEPRALVRRDDNCNITSNGIFITGDATNTDFSQGGTTYHGSVMFSEPLYTTTGNGQIINVHKNNQRIYFGNPNSQVLIESGNLLHASYNNKTYNLGALLATSASTVSLDEDEDVQQPEIITIVAQLQARVEQLEVKNQELEERLARIEQLLLGE